PEFKGIDFRGILADCDARALEHLRAVVLYDETASHDGPAALFGRPAVTYAALAGHAPLLEDRGAPDAGCAIFTTSGTTKAPKFVLHDQRTVMAHAADVVRGFAIDDTSTMLLAPLLCGVFGFCSAMAMIAAGRPTVLSPVWNPERAIADLVAHRVT